MNDAVLIQHGVGHCAEMIRIAAPFHARYCAHHKIDYRPDFQQRRRIGQSLYMEKMILLQTVLGEYPAGALVAWLDADALIVDPSKNLREALPEGVDLALLRQPDGEFNSGVMFFRAGAKTAGLVRAIAELGGLEHKTTRHDEGRLNWILDPEVKEPLPLAMRAALSVRDLPDEWNLWRINRDKEGLGKTVIQAWHGENHLRTRERMRRAAQKLTPPILPAAPLNEGGE